MWRGCVALPPRTAPAGARRAGGAPSPQARGLARAGDPQCPCGLLAWSRPMVVPGTGAVWPRAQRAQRAQLARAAALPPVRRTGLGGATTASNPGISLLRERMFGPCRRRRRFGCARARAGSAGRTGEPRGRGRGAGDGAQSSEDGDSKGRDHVAGDQTRGWSEGVNERTSTAPWAQNPRRPVAAASNWQGHPVAVPWGPSGSGRAGRRRAAPGSTGPREQYETDRARRRDTRRCQCPRSTVVAKRLDGCNECGCAASRWWPPAGNVMG